jgi:hypothetical protein
LYHFDLKNVLVGAPDLTAVSLLARLVGIFAIVRA